MKKYLTILLLFAMIPAFAQKHDLRRGNREFRKGEYSQADVSYRKGLLKDSTSVAARYNLANNLYKQGNYDEAAPYNYRQHDVFSSTNAGHEGYAWTIYTTGALPTQLDSQGHLDYQFYHPPFNALMQALMMHISKPFMYLFDGVLQNGYYNPNDMHSLFQTSEILSCFYMNVAIYFPWSYKYLAGVTPCLS